MGEQPSGPPEPIHAGSVAKGVVVGLLGAFAFYVVLGVLEYGARGDSATTGYVTLGAGVVVAVLFGAALVSKRFRQVGTGTAMGLAIGFIVLTGVCVPLSLTANG